MQKLKINDEVIILAGKDKNKIGKVLKINHKKDVVLIQGINMVKKTMKPSQENPTGGIFDKEQAIHVSNVSLISPKTKKPTRIRIEARDGKRVRVATKCGSVLK